MFKLIVIGALIYLFYRITMKPNQLPEDQTPKVQQNKKQAPPDDDGEFIDYEEID